MIETSARLLRLLALFQSQRYWSGVALSERLDVHPRTLRRDVDKLRSLGYPVHSTPGTEGGYQLGAGATLPPLLLDNDEAVAVAIGLRTAARGTVAGLEEPSLRALTKLEQVLPAKVRQQVEALHSVILPLETSAPAVDVKSLSLLAASCRDGVTVLFEYADRQKQQTRREVEPHQLIHTSRLWYLIAWDRAREDWRSFRLDRLHSGVTAGTRFIKRAPPTGGFLDFARKSITYTPFPVKAELLLHAPVESIPACMPDMAWMVTSVDEHSCVLHAGANSEESLAMLVAWLKVEFTILSPPGLAECVQRMIARLQRGVTRPAGPA